MNFKEIGNGKVDGFALVKVCDIKVSSKGGKYLDLVLSDKSGEISGKYWDYIEGVTPDFPLNSIIKVRGTISDFKGSPQLRIEQIRQSVPSDEIDPSDYIRSAEYDSLSMWNKITGYFEAFSDPDLKNLALTLYIENKDRLLYYPAAVKMHHAMRGGLLYHTLSIIELCIKVCEIYPSVDRDLLITGAALHDLGKTYEMKASELGLASEYTEDGNLIGHLVRGAMLVRACGDKLQIPDEKIRLIEHMLLSHHGSPDFGSPVRPMFTEAMILSNLDALDAKIYEFFDITSGTEPSAFSQRQWALDNVRIFNHGRTPDTEPKANLI